MDIIWIILKFILANILLIIVSSTLIGFIVRGLLQPRTPNPYREHKAEWYLISPAKGIAYSLGSAGITILLMILLIRYSNLFIVIGFLSWMLSRVKDLVIEIKTGIKTTNATMTRDKLDFALTLITWLGFIAFNYGLYLLWIK